MSLQICSAVCKRTILTPCDEGAYSSAAEQLAGWTHSVIEYDQMLSDSFPIREVDDIVYEVDCKLIQTRWDVDVEQGEAVEDGIIKSIDVVDAFRLQSTSFDKKSYLAYLKGYMKAISSYLQKTDTGRVQEFEKNMTGYAKKILGNIQDYEFYTGGS
ncbi:unnamed protein product [Penicillium nalgiovense]|uniref:Translationally-controlled tumor protein homolog n=1 Tax=Penicillium nalgiovense TaxID=60175 RepID=A0A9W4ILN5_PENNA|nr:unnamed protein product [Penicillium nalgiovense]CAG7964062.1 unnamed protein product [Penicillium nalgiovense]CAG7989244.1 unnamed protein product [Penicillium nalgiovense]CAG8047252.1 unnamed protein product [Penicillium nalgiovense]CAG8051371.1 unnamed protein product [Penicillium nalgiovense]